MTVPQKHLEVERNEKNPSLKFLCSPTIPGPSRMTYFGCCPPPCPTVSGTYSYPGSLPSSCSVVTPYHSPLGTFSWTSSESQAALPYLVKPRLFREASQRQSRGGEGRRGYFQFSPGSIWEWGDSGACRLHSAPAHSLSQPHVTLSGAYYVAGKVYSSFILANSHIVL